jgi:anti-sigma28 factor (negative regulator of flagellin synthesis)
MRVNPNSDAAAVTASAASRPAPQPRLESDKLALTSSDNLTRALAQTPEVRAEKVAEAKALIQDGSYPPEAIIRKISALLAIQTDV